MGTHKSVWIATAPPDDLPDTAERHADVAVIGAGITGLLTALELQRRGRQVLLIDARAPGMGTTGHTTGKITSQHSLIYAHLVEHFGEDKARMYAEANEWAVQAYHDLVQHEDIDCDFQRKTAYLFTERTDHVSTLEKEAQAARRAGIDARIEPSPLEFTRREALAFPFQAQLHPGKFMRAVAARFQANGGHTLQDRVTEVFPGKPCVVRTESTEISAGAVVIATLYPIGDHSLFAARMIPRQHHGMAFRIEQPPPDGMFLGVDDPTFSLRWTDADGGLLIAVGTSHRVGEFKTNPYESLAGFVQQHYPGAEERYRWSAHDHHTADRVPFIGWYRASTYVATGFRAWGLTHAMVASRLLSDLITGKPNLWEALYDPIRLKLVTSAPRVAVQGLSSARHLLLDRLRVHGDVASLQPGEATTFRQGTRFLGAYRDRAGEFHFVALSCPHMGCIVQWNPHDETWDCPCHGSRFDAHGEVLYGPATHGIAVSEMAPAGASQE